MTEKQVITAEQFVEAARAYIGVPYVHAGRTRFGVDCVGLLLCAAHDAGITQWDMVNYSSVVNCERLARDIERFCEVMPDGIALRPGDVLLFSILNRPQHTGIYVGD